MNRLWAYRQRHWNESSRLSKTAFWTVIVTAVLGLALVPVGHYSGSTAVEVLNLLLWAFMIVALIVQGIRLQHDDRRRHTR